MIKLKAIKTSTKRSGQRAKISIEEPYLNHYNYLKKNHKLDLKGKIIKLDKKEIKQKRNQ